MGTAFKLQNGQVLLSTEAPGGVYTAAQLRKIAELCDSDSALAKATEDQRLALFVAPQHVAKVASALRSTGLGVRHYQDGLHQPVNCIGELCPEHQQDAMGAGMEIAAELAAIKLESPLKIGINGCARGCVATHTLDISVLGDSNGYRISLGGKNSQIPEMAAFMADGVPSAKLPKLIAKIVSIYKEIAEPGESLQEVIERHGAGKFIAALAPYSQDAHQDESMGGGLDGFGSGEEVKLDDLGVPQHVSHDGPAIDVNLAEVELKAEPSVDGFRAEPTVKDEDDIVADHHDVVPESELEPIQPIDEDVFEETKDEVLVTSSLHDEEELIVDTAAPEAVADFQVSASEPVASTLAASDDLPIDQDGEIDAVRLEAASADLDHELDVKMEMQPTSELQPVEPISDEFEHDHVLEEELIADTAEHEALEPVVEVADVASDEMEVEPEHLVADEAVIEEAHTEYAAEVVHDEAVLEHEHDEPVGEEMHAAPEVSERDVSRLEEVAAHEVEQLHPVETQQSDQGADALPVVMEASGTINASDDSVMTPMPDESVVPSDATPLLTEPSLPADLLGQQEESLEVSDEFQDLSAEEIEAADEAGLVEDPALLGDEESVEIDEASEDQLERHLEAEIDAEGNIPEVEDTNRDDRHEAMQLIAAQAEHAEHAENAGHTEHAVAEPPVMKALEETNMAPTNFPPRSVPEPVVQSSTRAGGFDFIGLDFNPDGRISLQFASGAVMAIDPWAMVGATRRELRLAGKLIVLTPIDGGINVEVDGVAIFLPQRAAA